MFLRATPVPRATECSGSSATMKGMPILSDGRGLLQGRLDGVFHLLYGGVDAVGYLVV